MSDCGVAPHERGYGRQQGFTLLEIMAVVIIIAITVTFASLSLSSRTPDERLANEAQRLQQLLQLAAEDAVVQGKELGLLVASDGYRFYYLDKNRWTAYQEGSLRERHLPASMHLLLMQERQDEMQLPVPTKEKKKDDKQEEVPQILLLSSGELTPFTLELRADHLSVYYKTEGKITGDIKTQRLDAEHT